MTQHNKNFNVNDILLKFADPEVHDARQDTRKAASDRLHFQNYMRNKKIQEMNEQNRLNKQKERKHYIDKNDYDHRIHHDDALFEIRIRYVTIDSRDRDITLFPLANSYNLDISKHSLTNVISVELVSSTFLNTQLPVKNNNNVIHWYFEDDLDNAGNPIPYQVEIPSEPYVEVEDLLQVLQTAMSATKRHLPTKLPQTFIFEIDTDYTITISAYEWVTADDDGITISSTVGSSDLTIFWMSHGLSVGDNIFIKNVVDCVGGIIPSSINGMFLVSSVIDIDNFTISTNIEASAAETIDSTFEIGVPLSFNLLFGMDNSIGPLLQFAAEDTGFDTEHTNGTENLRDSFDLFDDQYIVVCSQELSGLFETVFVADNENTANECASPFAIIQMGGKYHDTVFNSYVGGKKVFYNNSIDAVNRVDFQFRYHNGDLVDFENSEHSFVLKFIQSIHKVQNVDFNTKIGSTTHTFTRKLRQQ